MSMKTIGLSVAFGATVQSSLGSAFKTIDEKTKGIEKSLKKVGLKKDLAINLKKAGRAFYDLQKEAKKTGRGSVELKGKLQAARIEFARAKEEAHKYGISLKNANKMQKAFSKLESLKVKNGLSLANASARKDYRANAKGQMLDKLAMGMAIAAPFRAGIEFESSMKRVQALSGATDEEFKQLEATAKKLGATTTFSASQAAEAMQYLSMAGFKANDTVKAMPGLLALAAAGQTDLATTADITSNILTGFGISADKTTHVADVMAKAMTSANVDTRMLGETMKYVAPTASGLGASLEEVTTLTAKLGDAGIQGTNAGTALRAMYARMASPPKEASKVIDRLGLQTKDANGNFVGMINILEQLQEKTKDMSNTDRAEVMKKLFGMEAMSGATALMKVPIEKLKEYEKGLEKADGTAAKIAKQQNDSVAGAFKALSSAIEGVSISISSLFLPALKSITQGITAMTSLLNGFIENHKTLATVVGGVAGGMIALSVAAFGLRYAFSFVADGFGSLWRAGRTVVFWMSAEGRVLALNKAQLIATAIRTKTLAFWQGVLAAKTKLMTLWTSRSVIAQRGAALAGTVFSTAIKSIGIAFRFALGPIGLIITGLSLVTAGIVWAYNKFEWFREGVSKAWSVVKEVFSWSPMGLVMDGFGKAFDWLSSKFEWFGSMVSKMKGWASSVGSWFGLGDDNEKTSKIEPAKAIKRAAVATAVTAQVTTAQPASLPSSSPQQSTTYTITINVNGGDEKKIAQEVRRAIMEIEDQKRNRQFSDEVM